MKKRIIQSLIVVSSLAVVSCGKDVKSPAASKPIPAAKPTSSPVVAPTTQNDNNRTCGSQSTTTSGGSNTSSGGNSNTSSGSMGY